MLTFVFANELMHSAQKQSFSQHIYGNGCCQFENVRLTIKFVVCRTFVTSELLEQSAYINYSPHSSLGVCVLVLKTGDSAVLDFSIVKLKLHSSV